MNYEMASQILNSVRAAGRLHNLLPLAIVVMDFRGAIRASLSEDGTSIKRNEIATGKANCAITMGFGSREIAKRPPQFLAAVGNVVGGMFVPTPGGVLVRDMSGLIIGAVGVSGDTSDNDELAAVEGISNTGLSPDPG